MVNQAVTFGVAEAEDRATVVETAVVLVLVKAAMLVMEKGATVAAAAWGEAVWAEAEAAEAVVVAWAEGSGGRKIHRTTRRNPGSQSRSPCCNHNCIL